MKTDRKEKDTKTFIVYRQFSVYCMYGTVFQSKMVPQTSTFIGMIMTSCRLPCRNETFEVPFFSQL